MKKDAAFEAGMRRGRAAGKVQGQTDRLRRSAHKFNGDEVAQARYSKGYQAGFRAGLDEEWSKLDA